MSANNDANLILFTAGLLIGIRHVLEIGDLRKLLCEYMRELFLDTVAKNQW